MRLRRALLTACLLALVVPASASAGFVQRSATNLSLDGKAFRFVGHNNYQLTLTPGQYSCGRPQDDATLDRVLQQAKDAGATVVRTWFFQSYYRGAQNTYAPFDRVLAKAAAKGLKVVPVLVNHYADCEPSGGNRKDERFYDSGYKVAGWGYSQSFKGYAVALASRYRANETIAFWQLVNEAEASSGGGCSTALEANGHQRAANVLRRFVTTWAPRSTARRRPSSSRWARSAPASAAPPKASTSTCTRPPARISASTTTTTARRSRCRATHGTGSRRARRNATRSASRC